MTYVAYLLLLNFNGLIHIYLFITVCCGAFALAHIADDSVGYICDIAAIALGDRKSATVSACEINRGGETACAASMASYWTQSDGKKEKCASLILRHTPTQSNPKAKLISHICIVSVARKLSDSIEFIKYNIWTRHCSSCFHWRRGEPRRMATATRSPWTTATQQVYVPTPSLCGHLMRITVCALANCDLDDFNGCALNSFRWMSMLGCFMWIIIEYVFKMRSILSA